MHAVKELALQRMELERIYIWVDYCSIPQPLGLCHVRAGSSCRCVFPQTILTVFPLNQNSMHTFDCRHPAQ